METKRLLSLDAFRGISIILMILVNTGGGRSFSQLQHASWHGWTFADTVFPFFLWIMGVSLAFSLTKRMKKYDKAELLFHLFKRSAILFILGMLLHLFPYFTFFTVRIPGVLQRIALCYFFAGLIFLCARFRGQVMWTGFLLILYWLLLVFVPVPGYGAGVLEKDGNIVQYVDTALLSGHLLEEGWDPEGLLSTLPAIASVLFGALFGQLFMRKRLLKTRKMFLLGVFFLFVGQLMHLWLPINKNLWTSSFSVFMAGLSMLVFSFFFWVVDEKKYIRWTFPLTIFGMNAITLYMLSGLIISSLHFIAVADRTLFSFFYEWFVLVFGSHPVASLLFSLTHILLLQGVAYLMYNKRWFLRV